MIGDKTEPLKLHLQLRTRTLKAVQAEQVARGFSQSEPAWRLYDPDADSGVHLPVPANRAAGLRDAFSRLRAGPQVRGVEKPETLHRFLQERGGLPRGRHQPHLR